MRCPFQQSFPLPHHLKSFRYHPTSSQHHSGALKYQSKQIISEGVAHQALLDNYTIYNTFQFS